MTLSTTTQARISELLMTLSTTTQARISELLMTLSTTNYADKRIINDVKYNELRG